MCKSDNQEEPKEKIFTDASGACHVWEAGKGWCIYDSYMEYLRDKGLINDLQTE